MKIGRRNKAILEGLRLPHAQFGSQRLARGPVCRFQVKCRMARSQWVTGTRVQYISS